VGGEKKDLGKRRDHEENWERRKKAEDKPERIWVMRILGKTFTTKMVGRWGGGEEKKEQGEMRTSKKVTVGD